MPTVITPRFKRAWAAFSPLKRGEAETITYRGKEYYYDKKLNRAIWVGCKNIK